MAMPITITIITVSTSEEGPLEENPIWMADHVTLVTVGIDIGSSGTQVIFSRRSAALRRGSHQPLLCRLARDPVPSPVTLTPYASDERIDEAALGAIIDGAYAAAGVEPEDIDTGVVVLPARRCGGKFAGYRRAAGGRARDFVRHGRASHRIDAGGLRAGTSKVSHDQDKRLLDIDIGGGTTKLAVLEKGDVIATAALRIVGRLHVVAEIAGSSGSIPRQVPGPRGRLLLEPARQRVGVLVFRSPCGEHGGYHRSV